MSESKIPHSFQGRGCWVDLQGKEAEVEEKVLVLGESSSNNGCGSEGLETYVDPDEEIFGPEFVAIKNLSLNDDDQDFEAFEERDHDILIIDAITDSLVVAFDDRVNLRKALGNENLGGNNDMDRRVIIGRRYWGEGYATIDVDDGDDGFGMTVSTIERPKSAAGTDKSSSDEGVCSSSSKSNSQESGAKMESESTQSKSSEVIQVSSSTKSFGSGDGRKDSTTSSDSSGKGWKSSSWRREKRRHSSSDSSGKEVGPATSTSRNQNTRRPSAASLQERRWRSTSRDERKRRRSSSSPRRDRRERSSSNSRGGRGRRSRSMDSNEGRNKYQDQPSGRRSPIVQIKRTMLFDHGLDNLNDVRKPASRGSKDNYRRNGHPRFQRSPRSRDRHHSRSYYD